MIQRPALLTAVVLCCCPLSWAGAPAAPYVADASTSLLLHLDEGHGEVPADAGQLGLKASVLGAKWGEGRFGNGLDCREGAAVVGMHPALAPEREVTVEAWVWVDGPSEEMQRIAYRSGTYGLYLGPRSMAVTFFVNAGGAWEAVRAAIPAKQWVHLAGTYDGAAMRFYVDGECKATLAKTGPIPPSAVPLGIGGDTSGTRHHLRGRIDEVRVSAVARTRFDPAERLEFATTAEAKPIAVPAEPLSVAVPTLAIGKAAAPPAIDGRLDDALWKQAASVALNDTRSGIKPSQSTQAWAAWDAERLYLAVRCSEARMKRLAAKVTDRDGRVWSDDCVEVFVRPEPAKPAYYHLVVNALGTLYDARCPRNDAAWQSSAQVAATRERARWMVEIAVPFAAFGITPKPGSRWRLNVARSERPSRELSSWSPVGGRFHAVGRHGWLVFAEQPTRPETGGTVLEGLVVDAQGRRVQGVAVSTPGGVRRTDVFGIFRVEGLPRKPAKIVIGSPRYHPVAVEATLARPVERIKLPPLREVDPNALAVAVPAHERGYRVYAAAPLDDLDVAKLPPKASEGAALEAFAAPGEYEPLGAAILATRAVAKVQVSVSGLRGPDGATLGAKRLDLRLVKRYLRRVRYNSSPDDAVFSSRYLLRPEPFDMAPNTFRRVHLIVHVPEQARPGVYRGTLRIAPANAPAAEMPIAFEVLGIQLGPPTKHYSAYFYGRHTGRSEAEAEAIIRKELADLRAHGADRLLWRPRIGYTKEGDRITFDYADVRKHVALLREFGFQPPYIVWTAFERLARLVGSDESEEFLRLGEQALRGLVALGKQEGWGEVAVSHMDEVFGRERLDRYLRLTKAVRRVPGLRMYITFHNQPRPEVVAMTREIDPFVDIRGYHGHSIDMWLGAGHSLSELGEQLRTSGDEAWCYYNPRSVEVTPEWQRIVNGFWLWLGPMTTHCPWIYNSYHGDPLDDADGFDFGYAFPVGDEIVATRLWEGYREGVDDVRYLSTLESLVARRKADAGKADAVREAQAFLDGLRKRLLAVPLEPVQSTLVRGIAERYTAADYDGWRRECARLIQRLAGRSK